MRVKEKISRKVVSIVLEVTPLIEIGSCDELYCDLSVFLGEGSFMSKLEWIKSFLLFVWHCRKQIETQTGCSCSIGAGHNLLMSRIATKL